MHPWPTFREWYARSTILRFYGLPVLLGLSVFLVPLILEPDVPGSRLVYYFLAGLLVVSLSVVSARLEKSEERRGKRELATCQDQLATADDALKQRIRIESLIEDVVKTKSKRFVDLCAKQPQNPLTGQQIFESITQPREQIRLLLEALYHFFKHGREDRKVRIVLFKPDFEAGHFRFFGYYPSGDRPATPEEEFSLNRGVCGQALQRGGIAVVEDIEADLKGQNPTYYRAAGQPLRKGSIVCLTVYDSELRRPSSILSVFVDEPNAFQEAESDLLRKILEPFATRLLLEERLCYLKENCVR